MAVAVQRRVCSLWGSRVWQQQQRRLRFEGVALRFNVHFSLGVRFATRDVEGQTVGGSSVYPSGVRVGGFPTEEH